MEVQYINPPSNLEGQGDLVTGLTIGRIGGSFQDYGAYRYTKSPAPASIKSMGLQFSLRGEA